MENIIPEKKNFLITIIAIIVIVALAAAAFFFFYKNQSLQDEATSSQKTNAEQGEATLSWDANTETDLAGYKIYYGLTPRAANTDCPPGGYSEKADAGKATSYTFSNLSKGKTYYFSVTSYDSSNNESLCSPEVSKIIDK